MQPILVALVAGLASVASSQQATPPHHEAHGDELGAVNFRRPALRPPRPSSSAASRCCTRTGSATPARRSGAVLEKDPGCAIAYWGLALDLLGNTLSAPPSRQNARRRLGVAGEGARSPGEDGARARVARRGPRVFPRSRDGARCDAAAGLQRRDGTAGRALSGRFRSAGVLRADAAGVGAEDGRHLRQPARSRRRCSSRSYARASAASGHHALPDSRLRLRAVRGARHPGGAALCGDRAGGASRAAHAGAHLLDGRPVGGLDHVESVGARDSAGLLPRGGLHRVRAPAAGAGQQRRRR